MDLDADVSKRTSIAQRGLSLIGALALLTGCVANSSNPVVSITSATMNDSAASIMLQLVNPGGRNLTVESLNYELSHGEIGFPLSSDTWTGQLDLPAQGEAQLLLSVVFDSAPFEEDSLLLHLNGELKFKDHTGFLGMSSMDLTGTSFQLDAEATRSER